MAKLQPSKLAMRVRFPLPASVQYVEDRIMKKTYLAIALLMGVFAAPSMAASPAWDAAVALSAQDSKATLADLCNAVYKAAKENPEKSPQLYEAVLAQRTNWTSSQCYAILRSILLALPGDVACNVGQYARTYMDAKGSSVKGQKVQRARYSATIASASVSETIFYGLLDALYNASLKDGVADETVASIWPTVTGVYENAFNAAVNNNDARLDTDGERNGVVPTAPDTSKNR